jgi:thiamine biosynthesis lipoprotein
VSRVATSAPAGLAELSWPALGSSVVLRTADGTRVASAREAAARELDAIDRACSRFREDSELVALNRQAGRPTRVSALLAEAIELALRAAELTDGDVDPTLGRALELIGYDRDFDRLPAADAALPRVSSTRRALGAPVSAIRVRARERSGWTSVRLDRDSRTLTLPRGVVLDLGATAKAWAADRSAFAAAAAAGCGVLVAIGGDVATAGPSPDGGWQVHVTDDHRSDPRTDTAGQTISIESGGVATSSITVRRWSHGGRDRHHILDPHTGEPAAGCWRTVSVAAADCADANIASTAAIVRGRDAPGWLRSMGLPARLVALDGSTSEVAGWPAP